jgi:hypothetical protein
VENGLHARSKIWADVILAGNDVSPLIAAMMAPAHFSQKVDSCGFQTTYSIVTFLFFPGTHLHGFTFTDILPRNILCRNEMIVVSLNPCRKCD